MLRQLTCGLVGVLLLTSATTYEPAWADEDPRVTVFNNPDHTIEYREVAELAEAALGDYPAPVTITFKEILFEDAPYTSGVFRRATKTIELRSTLTAKGIRYTLVHEVAHARTEAVDDDPHGPAWCAEYIRLLNELLPEYAEQQTRFAVKHYDCTTG